MLEFKETNETEHSAENPEHKYSDDTNEIKNCNETAQNPHQTCSRRTEETEGYRSMI